MAEMRVPGGYYIGADGKPHDANGKPIQEIDESPYVGGGDGDEPVDVPPVESATETGDAGPNASPAAIELAEANGIDLSVLAGSGAGGAIKVDDVRAAIAEQGGEDDDDE